MGSDRAIADSAWTSSTDFQKKKARTDEDVNRIINLLAKEKHSVPFESVVLRFWIKMPISADRQHVTHRIASHNGMSGRYRTMPSEWLNMPEDVFTIITKSSSEAKAMVLKSQYNKLCEDANSFYKDILDLVKGAEKAGSISNPEYKRVREKIRDVLPQGNMTERVTTINLRSFANYQKLRNSPYAQVEIKSIAELMVKAVRDKGVCPVALEALEKSGWQI